MAEEAKKVAEAAGDEAVQKEPTLVEKLVAEGKVGLLPGELPKDYQLVAKDYVHLHNHTHYSLLDGLTKIDELVDFVKEKGMEAVAVTDHGTMCGLVELFKTCEGAGIKPILGLEAYVAARNKEDRDPAYDKKRFHITLLAMNDKGFENLSRLLTDAEIDGKYYKPRTDHKDMEKYSEGVICCSGCIGSEISDAIRNDDLDRARKMLEWYHSVYQDRFYLEMQDHGHPDSPTHWDEQNKVNQQLMKFSEEYKIPLVVTCDAHYLKVEDEPAHEALLCIGTGAKLSDTNRMSLSGFQLNVIPPEDVISRWSKTCPEAVINTRIIAERCTAKFELGRILIPKFPIDTGQTEKEYLDDMVFRGLAERYKIYTPEEAMNHSVEEIRPQLPPEVIERIDYELSVVDNMGYNGYFLIVQDFINWGKRQGIIYGPGRGSAAGALLAYAIHITEVNPLDYDLLFERFLNPDRISMPDIDTDIQDTRRDEVIEYCTEKYGKPRVANIVTFGKMMSKNAVRDVARVLDVPYAEADRIAKLVPDPIMGHAVKLKDAIKDGDLKTEYESNPTCKEVIDLAMRLEGTIRGHGVHACGVVIAPDDIVKYMPMEVSAKGPLTTQYPGPTVEEIGLLKMDFLGLSNLSVIQQALRMIKKVYGQKIVMNDLPTDDPEVYKLFQRGDTTGVFQFESGGMKKYLRELKPTEFADLIAMNALYRPGPMQFIPSFIKRRHGEEPITYLHPGLENSLKSTYGILIYQEQFMQASKEWCGFTGGQADTLRKAVGKKKIDLMNKVKPQFIEGAVKIGGATAEIANTFWDQLLEFANYCFNKSHAACYALVAYWTAWLKAHYPDAYMAALMTSDMRWTERLTIEMTECKRMGMKVLGPDINESYADFGIVGQTRTIRFGLAAIKGMGKALAEDVIAERDANGKFETIFDFAKRVPATKFNKKSWESSIKCGVFDSFGYTRSDLLYNLESIQAYANKCQKDGATGQTDLFGMMGDAAEIPVPEMKKAPSQYTDKEQLLWERELMGLYISSHPLDRYDKYFEEQCMPCNEIKPTIDGATVIVGGIITALRTIVTKSGSKMAFVKIEDKTGEMEVIVFPRTYENVGNLLSVDTVVKVTGKVNATDRDGNMTDEAKVNASEIEVVTDEELNSYESTGAKLQVPTKGVKQEQRWPKKEKKEGESGSSGEQKSASSSAPKRSGGGGGRRGPAEKPVTHFRTSESDQMAKPVRSKKVYVRVEDPSNTQALMSLKEACNNCPGLSEVILVIGPEKKAMRMPFKCEPNEGLVNELISVFGSNGVVVK